MPNRSQNIIFFLLTLFAALIIINFTLFHDYRYLAVIVFACIALTAYLIHFEFFILLFLFINEEGFYLLPRTELKEVGYQDLCYPAMLLLLVTGYLFKKRDNHRTVDFKFFIMSFLFLIFMGIFNSYFQRQPLILGLKAAKYYFLMLFYFIFSYQEINLKRLTKMIVATGVILTLLNNIQYLHWGKLTIFHYETQLERFGTLRFLIGDFFTIFTPLMSLGEYLKTKKKMYLLAFIYMVTTVILQGQTRGVIFGLTISSCLLLYFSRKLNFIKAIFLGMLLLILFIWFFPALETTLPGKLIRLSSEEISGKIGNVGVRFEGYEYYFRELLVSPILGRGIWNDTQIINNPENLKSEGIHLSDIGITDFLFHFGLLGLLWMLLLFKKIFKILFKNIKTVNQNIHYGIVGYFIFSIFTAPTLNCLVGRKTIIYFALVLALISQSAYTEHLSGETKYKD